MSEAVKRVAAAPRPAPHRTETSLVGTAVLGAQGGEAQARCDCGWRRSVPYNRDRLRDEALTLVREFAVDHVADPEKETEQT